MLETASISLRLRSTVGGVREGAEEQGNVVVLFLGTGSNLEDDLKKNRERSGVLGIH